MTSADRRLATIAVVAAVAIRLLFVFLPATPLETKTVDSVPDAAEYVRLAGNIARHRTFSQDTVPPVRPELFRTPGYPMLLAPLAAVFPGRLWPILLLQLLMSVALVWLVRRLAAELGMHASAGGIAALLVALSPNLAFLATKAVTETFFTLLLVACLLLLNRFRQGRRATDLLGAGLCSGLLVLVRPIALFFPAVLTVMVLAWWLHRRDFRPAAVLLPLACAAVVIAPWMLRNGRLTGRYVVSTAGEHNLFLYNAATVLAAERGTGLAEARDAMRREATERHGSLDADDEAEFWSRVTPVAVQHLLRRPMLAAGIQAAGFVACFASPISLNPLMVHSGAHTGNEEHVFQRATALALRGRLSAAARLVWEQRLNRLGAFGWVVLVAAGLFLMLLMVLACCSVLTARGRGLRWLLVPLVYFTLVVGPVGEARFRAPVEPVLALFAGAGLALLLERRRGRTGGPPVRS